MPGTHWQAENNGQMLLIIMFIEQSIIEAVLRSSKLEFN